MTVEHRRLGKHGVLVSNLCLGTMNFGWHTSEEDSFRIMDRALELGINFFDTADVYGWSEEHGHTEEIIGRIEEVFSDDRNGGGIKLSSIHRAKGLEADRVFFLKTEEAPCPHPLAKSKWQRDQELNLLYVGITRAKMELVWIV